MIIDLHVHTTAGSADSSLTVAQLTSAARSAGVDGVVVAEHIRQWTAEQAWELQEASGLLVVPAAEWVCEYGHVLVLGIDAATRYTGPLTEMRRIVDAQGGFIILAHPFRYFPGAMNLLFNRWPDAGRLSYAELARHPAFALVDAIETLNNGCTDAENRHAEQLACAIGMPGVAGSDAHSADELGRCVTVFDEPLGGCQDLVRQLRIGAFHAERRTVLAELDHGPDD